MNNTDHQQNQNSSSINSFIKISFRTTFYFLIFACVLSIFTFFYVKPTNMKTILIIETVITAFAAYIYSFYINLIYKYKLSYENLYGWFNVDRLRYIDWSITTPLMLVSLVLVLSSNNNTSVSPATIFILVILDWLMLLFGFLGETKQLSRITADILGFVPFAGIFWLLYRNFIQGKYYFMNYVLFGIYFVIWSMYGLLYMADQKTMNATFNILDCIAKAFVSIGISTHFLLLQ